MIDGSTAQVRFILSLEVAAQVKEALPNTDHFLQGAVAVNIGVVLEIGVYLG